MSVIEREARSLTKNAMDAPALGVALPVRKRSPVDFWMCVFQMLPPLNVKMGYMIQKAAEEHVKDGKLPAAARNELLEKALSREMDYLFFLDDDVLFPDITLYRLWVNMQKHPEFACITAVGPTKLTPAEPLIYQDGVQGAWWDWQLGALTPIHSAWAGCMLVNLDFVRKLKGPWFDDVVYAEKGDPNERVKQNIWGQDRWFHQRLRNEAGGIILADTGLLVAHYDADLQKAYILPPDAPCFSKPILGESFIPFFDDNGQLAWTRIYIPDRPDNEFKSYLQWLEEKYPAPKEQMTLIGETEKSNPKVEQKEGFTVTDSRRVEGFDEWFKEIGALS